MSDFIGIKVLRDYPELSASTHTPLGTYYISFNKLNIVCDTHLSDRAVIINPDMNVRTTGTDNRYNYYLYCLRLMNENPDKLDELLIYRAVTKCPFCNKELTASLREINYCPHCGRSREDIIKKVKD